MKQITLRFAAPRLRRRPWEKLSTEVRFPFTAVDTDLLGAPEEANETRNHALVVDISDWARNGWDVDDEELKKVMFEIGKRKAVERLKSDELPMELRVSITYDETSTECPFDPARIQGPDGAVVQIDLPNMVLGFKS